MARAGRGTDAAVRGAAVPSGASINGWNASRICSVPLKLIDRGATPCLAAAWAMTVRIRL